MRRSICLLALLAAGAAAPLAFAQDTQTQAAASDAGAPTASVSASAAPPPPVTAAPAASSPFSAEQEPLQLGRFLELEADRAKTQRVGGAVVGLVGGAVDMGISIGLYAYLTQNLSSYSQSDQVLIEIVGIMPIVLSGTVMLTSLITLFSSSPMESLFDHYAPIAIDKSLSPAQRVGRGEGMLQAAAETEHARRVVSGVTNFVLAAIATGCAIGFGADTGDFPSPNNALLALTFGALATTSIIGGVASLWWERGPAEIAWEQWKASHDFVTVQTSKLHIVPIVAPTVGGAYGGLSVTY